MALQQQYEDLFRQIPDSTPQQLTFIEIAGFPHYENVCSNILKFFFNNNTKVHLLEDLVLTSFLEALKSYKQPFTNTKNLKVKREVVTKKGRIDLLIYTTEWVIAIENKIRHILNNDLEDYAQFLDKEFPNHKHLKVVLSINQEISLRGGFVNLLYKDFVKKIESNLSKYSGNKANAYFLFLQHFLETIKNLYTPIPMEKTEIDFLIANQTKIDELIRLENKFNSYVNQRAHYIKNNIQINSSFEKWVYEGYDVGFHYAHGDNRYKIECLLDKNGISIVICVEINTVDDKKLEELDFFKKKDIKQFQRNPENNRLIIEEGIDFFISDDILIEKLQNLLAEIKVSE
jgi:hypothetical protein